MVAMDSLNSSQPQARDLVELDEFPAAAGWKEHASLKGIAADLEELARTHKATFQSASPWPHVVFDDLIDPALIAAAEREELEPSLALEVERNYRKVKAESPQPNGPAAQQILESIGSAEFVAFLEELTGVSGLTPDPTHYWAGLHVNPPGAFQAIHRDFRVHPITGLFHRVNILIYLNSDWKSEYAGELELWKPDRSACEKQVPPLAGKSVIFDAGARAIHGIPEPIRCPTGRARLSLAAIYYTVDPPPNDQKESRFFRPKRPQDPWYMGFGTFGDAVNLVRRTIERRSATKSTPGG
jgi:Rps23 Pro-64 3,4-dihydroxylase Tpa1-like proline 4-hydroxylase